MPFTRGPWFTKLQGRATTASPKATKASRSAAQQLFSGGWLPAVASGVLPMVGEWGRPYWGRRRWAWRAAQPGTLTCPPVAASPVPVAGPEAFEDDAFDVVVMAGGEEGLGGGPGEAAHDSTGRGQVELLEDSPALGVRPVHPELVVEPEEIEGPERQGSGLMVAPAAGEAGEEGVEITRRSGAATSSPSRMTRTPVVARASIPGTVTACPRRVRTTTPPGRSGSTATSTRHPSFSRCRQCVVAQCAVALGRPGCGARGLAR
jgi:hypothetical protein